LGEGVQRHLDEADLTDQGLTPAVVTATNQPVALNQSVSFSNIFSVSGSGITQYQVYFSYPEGGAPALGTVTNNGSPIAKDQAVTLASLGGLAYLGSATPGVDKIWVKAFNGTWTGWTEADLTDQGNLPHTIGAGETMELTGAYSGTITFAGTTGTLKLDNSSTFSGKIGGQLAIGDTIDLADITAGASAAIAYSGNNTPGTLMVSDGTHTANIALSGNYLPSNFTASTDGHGGTSVVDPPLPGAQNDNAPLEVRRTDPADSQAALNQQLSLLGQHMASAFPSSPFGSGSPAAVDGGGGQLPNLTPPVAEQRHT
jgi:hypothetical protein